MRILWNEKEQKPVLFRERYYINQQNVRVEKLLNAMCINRAKKLNLPLYHGEDTPELKSLGGLAPFEYVDAAGGVQYNGVYTIKRCGFTK